MLILKKGPYGMYLKALTVVVTLSFVTITAYGINLSNKFLLRPQLLTNSGEDADIIKQSK